MENKLARAHIIDLNIDNTDFYKSTVSLEKYCIYKIMKYKKIIKNQEKLLVKIGQLIFVFHSLKCSA